MKTIVLFAAQTNAWIPATAALVPQCDGTTLGRLRSSQREVTELIEAHGVGNIQTILPGQGKLQVSFKPDGYFRLCPIAS